MKWPPTPTSVPSLPLGMDCARQTFPRLVNSEVVSLPAWGAIHKWRRLKFFKSLISLSVPNLYNLLSLGHDLGNPLPVPPPTLCWRHIWMAPQALPPPPPRGHFHLGTHKRTYRIRSILHSEFVLHIIVSTAYNSTVFQVQMHRFYKK